MSYDNTKYYINDSFDEFCFGEAMSLTLIKKGMKWHRKDKVFEDYRGVFWSEEIVFGLIDKVIHQTILKEDSIQTWLKDLAFRRESLLESVTKPRLNLRREN